MLYRLIRPLVFMFDPETAHALTLRALSWRGRAGGFHSPVHHPIELMCLQFPNRVGLAAGFDKNAVAVSGLAQLGFGHLEVGTVTPKAQLGNDGPRIFRLTSERAIINRMGFPNLGVDALVERIKQLKSRPLLGINIGKNKDTSTEDAVNDYVYCLQKAYPVADYITVNISSPNTPQLRDLQNVNQLGDLLETLKNMQSLLSHEYQKYVPLVVKVAPDLEPNQVSDIAKILLSTQIDGLIATNTTISRIGVEDSVYRSQPGGLSGAPLTHQATRIISQFRQHLGVKFPIIGVGGVMSVQDAQDKFDAGADLVQLYTGLVYSGPELVTKIVTI